MSKPTNSHKILSLLEAVSEIIFRISTKSGEILEYHAPKHLVLWTPRDKIVGFNILDIELEGISTLINTWKNGEKEAILNNSFETIVKGRNFKLSVKYAGENEVFVIAQDITELKTSQSKLARRDKLIKDIEQGVSPYVGQEFFDHLSIELSKALKADYIIIGQSTDCLEVDTISFVAKGEIANEFSYPVEEVPCKETLAKGKVCYTKDVHKLFPKSDFFIVHKTEAYIGSALADSSNKAIGVLVAMFDKPIEDGELFAEIINIFCSRASAELVRIQTRRALKQSEQKYRDIFETLTDVYYKTDADNTIRLVSPSIEALSGYKVADIIGKKAVDFQISSENYYHNYKKLLSTGKLSDEILQIKRADGEVLYVSSNVQAQFDDDGNFKGATGTIRDVTTTYKQKLAIEESEAKFRAIFNSINDIYCEIDEHYNITVISPSVKQISGHSPQVLLGKNVKYFLKDVIKLKTFIEALTKHGYIHNYQFEMLNAQGGAVPVELNVNAKYDDKGNFAGAVGMLRDISQPKKAEKILRESEAKFKSIFDSLTDVYYKTNAERIITLVSPSVKAFSGYTPEELIGKSSVGFYVDKEENERLRAETLKNGQVNNFIINMRHKNGKALIVSCNVKAEYDKAGTYSGAVGLLRDIKDIVVAQEKRKDIAKRYKNLFETSNDAIFISDVKTAKILDVNQKAISLFGYSKEEFKGMPLIKISHPDKRSEVKKHIEELLEKQQSIFECAYIKKDSGKVIVEVSARLMMMDGRQTIQSIIRDISTRKKHEQTLLESEKKYKNLFENSSDAVMISDPKTRKILDVNQKMVHMMGYSKEELQTKSFFDIRLKINRISDEISYNSFLRKGEDIYQSTLQTATGECVDVEGSAKLLKIDNKDVIQAFLRDITERKREEKILSLNKIILEKVARESDIYNILKETCTGIEEIYPEMICSVLIYDEVNNWLNYGAGPSLPKYYTKAVNSFPIGADCCSCGTAAYYKKPTIVSDIANDPLWKHKKDIALKAKLRACWSVPMLSSNKTVLGTFAVYYREVRKPRKKEIDIISNFSNLVGVALESHYDKNKLTSNEKRYRQLVNNSPVGILIHTKGIIKFVNNEVLKIGKADEKEQLLGKNVMDFVISDYKIEVRRRLDHSALDKKSAIRVEEKFKCLDDTIIDVEVMTTPITYQGRASSQLVFYDITKRKKTQAKLIESEVRYRKLVDNSPVGILIHTKGIVKFVNKEVLNIIKFKDKKEIIGKSGMTFMIPKFKTGIKSRIKKVQIENKSFSRVEEQFYCTDGSIVDVEVMGTPVIYQGEPSTQLVFQDITERKKAALELKKSEEKYRSLNDSVFDGIIIANQEGNIISWNHGAEKIFNYSQEEVINESLTMIMPEQYRSLQLAGLKKFNDSKKSKIIGNVVELEGLSKNGRIFPIEISFSNWKIDNKHFYSAIIRDITERKAIEVKQKSLNDFLIKQNKQLEEFAYITSHNLRAPIANINSLVQLQEMDDSEETSQFVFEQLKAVADGLYETINDLTVVMETSWEVNKETQKLKFATTIKKIKNALSRRIIDEKVNVSYDFSQAEQVEFPKVYLESIMQNLILNAIKYRNPEVTSWIKVSTETTNGYTILHIADNGLGIDMKLHGKKLFGLRKTFHKNKDAKGVGLFMTKAQVESMGGKIEVTSKVGKGTTFSVFIKN